MAVSFLLAFVQVMIHFYSILTIGFIFHGTHISGITIPHHINNLLLIKMSNRSILTGK
jgi:hypothetical protein